MGYRSDVAYAIRFRDADHRIRFMATQALSPHIDLNEFELYDDETILFIMDGVKWYAQYHDVDAHERLYEEAEADGCGCEFYRIGEDNQDIESRQTVSAMQVSPPEIITIYRSMEILDDEGRRPYPIGEALTSTK